VDVDGIDLCRRAGRHHRHDHDQLQRRHSRLWRPELSRTRRLIRRRRAGRVLRVTRPYTAGARTEAAPSWRRQGVANLLDVFATSNTKLVSNVTVDNADCLSDHCLITADIAVRTPKPVVTYSSRKIRSIDVTSFEDDLRKSVLFTQLADTLDAYVDQFNAVVEQLLDKVAPVRSRRRRPQKPISKWLSSEAIDAKRSRRRLERRWRSTGAEADPSEYRQACRKANQLINASRTTYYRQCINEAGSNYRLRWKIVNDLLHSHDTDSTRTDTLH